MFHVFKDVFIEEPEIMVMNPKQIYDMESEIEKVFKMREYFRALMMTSNMIEAFLRRFYHYHSTIEKGSSLLVEEAHKNDKIPLSYIMCWANGKEIKMKIKYKPSPPKDKIITDEEFKMLIHLKNIRNDIAHVYYLNFDENINPEYAKKIIDSTLPILSKLIEKFSLREK